jgi:hypothetical protein
MFSSREGGGEESGRLRLDAMQCRREAVRTTLSQTHVHILESVVVVEK